MPLRATLLSALAVSISLAILWGAPAPVFRESSITITKEVLADRASEIHEVRDRFLAAFRHRLALLQKASRPARYAGQVVGAELPEAKSLEAEAEALGSRLDRLAARWQTPEDLEELAADRIELPTAGVSTPFGVDTPRRRSGTIRVTPHEASNHDPARPWARRPGRCT